jgi:hypothetical protein
MALTYGKKKSVTGKPFTTIKVHEVDIPAGGLTEQLRGIQKPQTIYSQKDLLNELKSAPKIESSISISVNRYFTDLNGNVLDKNLIPDSLKVKFPFYLFGKQDFDGGFYGANMANPTINSVYFQRYISGEGFDWFALQGGDIWTKYHVGDMVLVFADSYPDMSYLIFVVVSCDRQAYGSILKDQFRGALELTEILYILDNKNNYNERISFVQLNNLSVPKIDYYQPLAAFTPEQKQVEFIKIPLHYKMNPLIGLGSYIQFETEFMNFEFKVKHF